MKNIKSLIFVAITLLAFAFTNIKLVNWKLKDNYRVKCVENGVVFNGLKTDILFDETKPEQSKIKASIDATNIITDVPSVTIKVKELLEVDKFPIITFESTTITKTGQGQYEANGNLTLKGVTKDIKFPFNFDSKKGSVRYPIVDKETFAGTFTFSPKDFNIEMEKRDKLTIEFIIPVSK